MRLSHSKRGYSVVCIAGAILGLFTAPHAVAQSTSGTAQLSVNLSVQSSISLVFQNDPSVGSPGFCPLSNANTNNVGLDLGSASYTGGASSSCVSYSQLVGGVYQVSSAFDVVVTKANSSSPNYRLQAQISTVPPANVSWLINNVALTTAPATLDAADNYGQAVTKTLQVQVKNSVAAQVLQETITFLATAN